MFNKETDIFATISLDKTLFTNEEIQRIRNDVESVLKHHYGKKTNNFTKKNNGAKLRKSSRKVKRLNL